MFDGLFLKPERTKKKNKSPFQTNWKQLLISTSVKGRVAHWRKIKHCRGAACSLFFKTKNFKSCLSCWCYCFTLRFDFNIVLYFIKAHLRLKLIKAQLPQASFMPSGQTKLLPPWHQFGKIQYMYINYTLPDFSFVELIIYSAQRQISMISQIGFWRWCISSTLHLSPSKTSAL